MLGVEKGSSQRKTFILNEKKYCVRILPVVYRLFFLPCIFIRLYRKWAIDPLEKNKFLKSQTTRERGFGILYQLKEYYSNYAKYYSKKPTFTPIM